MRTMATVMGKSSAKHPLTDIFPNRATIASRTRSRGKSGSGPPQPGKENEKRSSRGRRKAESNKDAEASPALGEDRSWKRARSTCAGNSRGGSQNSPRDATRTGALIVNDEDSSSANENNVNSQQIEAPPHDLPLSGAALRVPAAEDPSAACAGEYRHVACSIDQVGVTVQVAVTTTAAAAAAPSHQKPLKTYERRQTVSNGPPKSGSECSEALMKGRASVDCCGRSSREDRGMSTVPANPPTVPANPRGHDECRNVEARLVETADHQAADLLQNSYDKLFKKYQDLKAKQFVDAEKAYDEQSRRIEKFSTAADSLVHNLRFSKSVSQHEPEFRSRAREMEAKYIECQNDLVLERAKNLELEQRCAELEEVRQRCADLEVRQRCADLELRQQLELDELRGSRLMRELLQNVTQFTIVKHGKSDITFSHDECGFEFTLEQNNLSEVVGGKDALLYRVTAAGTLGLTAPDWMLSEIVFDMTQADVCFQRISAVCSRGRLERDDCEPIILRCSRGD